MPSGIYVIRNLLNGKSYVGSALDLGHRKRTHFYKLRHNAHPSRHLQAAFAKHGEAAFEFSVLEELVSPDRETLIGREQWWMDLLKPQYNKRLTADSNQGVPKTDEERAAQSASLIAWRATPEGAKHKEALREIAVKSWADPEKREARLAAIKAAWTPEKREAASMDSKARQSHISPDGTHFGTARIWDDAERAKTGEKSREAWAKRLTTTEDDIRRIAAETNPAWTAVEMTGVRNVDKVRIHCSVHNHDQWQTVAKLRHAQRGCKLCGYQRSSEVQSGRAKSQSTQTVS
jgi:group I intron endonuclease